MQLEGRENHRFSGIWVTCVISPHSFGAMWEHAISLYIEWVVIFIVPTSQPKNAVRVVCGDFDNRRRWSCE